MPQKEISGFLTFMWKADPFKAKWAVLAKAYSVIRDNQGKINAPLDEFLAINGSFVGVVEPANYLHTLGWKVTSNIDGQNVLCRDNKAFDADFLRPHVSVNDVIRNSFGKGYCVGEIYNVLLENDETAVKVDTLNNPTAVTPSTAETQTQQSETTISSAAPAPGNTSSYGQQSATVSNVSQNMSATVTSVAPNQIHSSTNQPDIALNQQASTSHSSLTNTAPVLSHAEKMALLDYHPFDPTHKIPILDPVSGGDPYKFYDLNEDWMELVNFDACL